LLLNALARSRSKENAVAIADAYKTLSFDLLHRNSFCFMDYFTDIMPLWHFTGYFSTSFYISF